MSHQSSSIARWQRRLLPAELMDATEGRRSPRDWLVDSVLFGLALAVGAAALYEVRDDHSDVGLAADALVGTAACFALWLRRRHPAGVAFAVVAVGAVSAMAGGAGAIAVFNAAVRCSRGVLLALVGMWIVAAPIFALLYPSSGGIMLQMAIGLLLLAVVVGWGLFTRVRRELVLSLRERAARVESEQRLQVEQARDAERRRIAREMHDVLAHRLSLLSVHAGALEFRRDASPGEVAHAAEVIRATAQAALDELRDVIGLLRDDEVAGTPQPPQPTLAQLPALIEESREAGMSIASQIDVSDELPAAVGRTAYRVVQEGLTNARKHAPGAAVEVRVDDGGDELIVEVVSRPPVGAPSSAESDGSGAGLVGVEERVSLAGGRLTHGPNEAGNFVLRAELPWTQ